MVIRCRENEHSLSGTVVAIFDDLPDGDKGSKLIKNAPLDVGNSIE